MLRGPQSKQEYFRRWFAGEFGNKPRTWDTISELMDDPYQGLVSIRWKDPGDKRMIGDQTKAQVLDKLRIPKSLWHQHSNYTFNESMPNDKLVIQGHLNITAKMGLEFHCSTELGVICRYRYWKKGQILHGANANLVLRDYVPDRDLEHLYLLLEWYPETTIEFATFSVPVGDWETSTIVWEVREF